MVKTVQNNVIVFIDEVSGYQYEQNLLDINCISAKPLLNNTEGVRVLFTDAQFGIRAADFSVGKKTIVHNMPLNGSNVPGFTPKSEFQGVIITGMAEDADILTMNFTVTTK